MKQFINDNLFSVVMAGVAVLGLLGILFPVLQIGAANEHAAELDKVDRQLVSALNTYESPAWNAESEEGLKEIRQIQEDVIKQALKFATRPPLLVRGRLPFPEPDIVNGSRFDFQQSYSDGLDALLKEMEAGALPTEREIADAVLAEEKKFQHIPGHQPQPNLRDKIRANLVADRARSVRVWATRSSFDDYVKRLAGPSGTGATAITRLSDRQMWDALVNWWIQRDLAAVISEFNRRPVQVGNGVMGQPLSVVHSPIKELVWTQIQRDYLRSTAVGSAGPPVTLTGRVTNERYHVLLYSFQVVMDPTRFNDLLGSLQARNFHTVISFRKESLDRKGMGLQPAGPGSPTGGLVTPVGVPPTGPGREQDSLEYGGSPVSVYTLTCEAIFTNSPASWRGHNEQQGREKRLAFLREVDNRKMVLEVHEVRPGSPTVVRLSYEQLHTPAGAAELDKLLSDSNPNLRFIFLYEDLMPNSVKVTMPGFGGDGR